jgi:non-specific serine/threonine protein kinase
LIFSQFREVIDPLARFLAKIFGRKGLVLHGGTPVAKRQKLVQTFQEDPGVPFFVLTVKTGGVGLNLTAAPHVIHFDRWWNPAVEKQATDRAYRIGQHRNVLVHRLICQGTIEERIDQMLYTKQELSDDIIKESRGRPLTEMSNDELLSVLSLDLSRIRS